MPNQCGDMIVNLTTLPEMPALPEGVCLKRGMVADRAAIVAYVRENFGEHWVGETEAALASSPSHCIIAVKDHQVVGFACWDATIRNFFGPTGVSECCRGTGIGTALLIRTLEHMRADGYAYAIIGWVDDAAPFYKKVVGAEFIPGGDLHHSVYTNMIAID